MFKEISSTIKNLFSNSTPEISPEKTDQLETLFKQRYHFFKLLLAANSKALESMTELDLALRGNTPFGMSFIRSRCTALCATVFRIIRNIELLAPEKYTGLKPAFTEIQKEITNLITPSSKQLSTEVILPLSAIDKYHSDQVGNKLANLGELKNNLGILVPDGFVLTTRAYNLFMEHNELKEEIFRFMQIQPTQEQKEKDDAHLTPEEEEQNAFAFSSQMQKKIIQAKLPQELIFAIEEQVKSMVKKEGSPPRFALRSSALGEDDLGTSFAGQYHSELNVEWDELKEAYKEVVASKYTVQAFNYRLQKGIKNEDVPMCVGCIEMIDATAGGVVYTRNPTHPHAESLLISADWGLGKSVVDGTSDPDMFIISRTDNFKILQHTPGIREKKLVCDPEKGLRWQELNEKEKTTPPLTEEQIHELSALSLKIEDHYGLPQDIEWVVSPTGKLVIVQTRSLRLQPVQKHVAHAADKEKLLLFGGMTASPGAAHGEVFIVQKDVDLLLFPDNAILVSSKSIPKWASVLSKAAGIITEHGSIVGHLANVAREFETPAIFGMKGILEKLQNGQEITLVADSCAVYEGKISKYLQTKKKTGLMHGSPVHENLKTVCKHILPLNLIDPDSLDFKAENCTTLHDITRFCHEKAVQEMFAFGKNHNFASKSSKQLKAHVPMQWWLIDLDDGFTHRIEGPFVKLKEITSIPMLAIWKGATAIPWEGPPAMDGKGMAAVLFQATMNPQLNVGTASEFANRNYFMISKNFCNLQSRFGFHFMTVEALVGERVRENYIRFQFKGGAADFQRKVRRAEFIGELLEKYDFVTRIQGDALFARMDNYPKEELEKKLWILGHLLIHTRQLDMIMSREEIVAQYKDKIFAQIDWILEKNSK